MLPSLRVLALGAGLSVSVCLASPLAAEPRLVADLNRGQAPESQEIALLKPSDEAQVAFFAGRDPAHGGELWRTDGSPQGTVRVADVCPGPCDSSPDHALTVGGQVFFTADDGVSGRELWVSDGTPGSERPVRDICPGPCTSEPGDLEELGGRLLFMVTLGYERQLWVSDGTREGTVRLAPLPDQETSQFTILPGSFVRLGGVAVFSLAIRAGLELWRTDGTAAGTWAFFAVLGPEFEDTSPVAVLDGAGYFWTHSALWRTDGTVPGTVQVKSEEELGISIDDGVTVLVRSAVWQGRLYSIGFGPDGFLILSDGTASGTAKAASLVWPGEPAALPTGVVYSKYADGPKMTLVRIQGTGPEETLFEIDPGQIDAWIPAGDRVYFFVDSWSDQTFSLWVTDGTAAGTREVEEGATPIYDWVARPVGLLTAGAASLWRRNADGSGPVLLHDFNAVPGGSGPLSQAVLGGRLIFSAQTSHAAAPLFVSDGTAGGTRLLRGDVPWAASFTAVGSGLFFTSKVRLPDPAVDPTFRPNGIWATDGTAAGTVLRGGRFLEAGPMTAFAGDLFFNADDQRGFGIDRELWRTNGSRSGVRVAEINPHFTEGLHHICYPEGADPEPGIVLGGRLLFGASDGRAGFELWTTDGTAPGTFLLKDINLGRQPRSPGECDHRSSIGLGSAPSGFLAFQGGALFAADDGKTGRELWWTNGTRKGTRRVADAVPGPEGSAPRELTAFGGQVYFFLTDPEDGDQLWRTDGTAAGTIQVHDLQVNGERSWAHGLTAAGDRLFFAVYNEATGAELWSSEGDGGSTGLVADLRPGAAGSYPQSLTAVGGVLVFAATDGASGLEPWRSDGTAAGTRRLGDINPGPDASAPGPFSRLGGDLLTGACDAAHGRELWAIPVEDVLTDR